MASDARERARAYEELHPDVRYANNNRTPEYEPACYYAADSVQNILRERLSR